MQVTDTPTPPKLFISYSWSSPEHCEWVLQFANELVSQGIHVLLDRWDLKPGHDTYHFMESMVTDVTVTKVLMICDAVYVGKSNSRQGGAGTEAQIITPEIYAHVAQDKFAAVVREKDDAGKAYVPTYYKGRLYFDLEDQSRYAEEFERIVRWAWNAPAYVRPPLGPKPAYLSKQTSSPMLATSVSHRRAMDALRSGNERAAGHVNEYLKVVTDGMASFRLSSEGANDFDEKVVESINDFIPYRNELIELFNAVARFEPTIEMLETLHRFFERCMPYLDLPEGVSRYSDWDPDNLRFIVHELFLYLLAAFIGTERYDAAAYFVDNDYYCKRWRAGSSEMESFTSLDADVSSLSHRNKRLQLRRVSVRADLLKERNQGTGVPFEHLQAADLVLYLRAIRRHSWHTWFPETLLFANYHQKLEMFARAQSQSYFNRIKKFLGVRDVEDFKTFMVELLADPQKLPRWDFRRGANLGTLTGANEIATRS